MSGTASVVDGVAGVWVYLVQIDSALKTADGVEMRPRTKYFGQHNESRSLVHSWFLPDGTIV